MSVLHYQLWTQVKAQDNFDGRLIEKKASGTILEIVPAGGTFTVVLAATV